MKIVYYDCWTKGISNFQAIDSELKKLGHKTILLHTGSFNAEQIKEEMIEGIQCRDISYYKTKMIYKLLEQVKPDVAITLNTTQLLDRVFTLSCRKLNIKSVYLMHGIRNLEESNDQLVALMEQSYNSIFKKIKKAKKYLSIVIPNYLYALAQYKPINILNFRFLRVVFSYFKNPGRSFYFPEYRDEIANDVCLVYSSSEGRYYEKLGYNARNIRVVGNPKYDSLHEMLLKNKLSVEMLPQIVRQWVDSGQKYAVYLEEAFPEQNNMGGYTAEVRNRFIMEFAERLEKENVKLVVKLHPTTKEEAIKVKHDNLVIEKNHLDVLIFYSQFCICSLSTTINNCVLMNKPVVMPRWSEVRNLPTFFVNAGVSHCWNNKDDKLNLTIDSVARKKYVDDYITVVTPDAVKNIVKAIV